MPVSVIEKAALIVLDLQVATGGLPSVPHTVANIVGRSVALADAFRAKDLPVVWVTVGGGSASRVQNAPGGGELPGNWAEPLPELAVQPADHLFVKYAWGAFHDDRLAELLAKLNVEQIVLTGVTTSYAVESTARAAYDRGLHVVVVADAIGDLNPEAHANSIERVFPNLGELGTADEVIDKL